MPYHEINEVVSHKLRSNRDRHEQLVNKLISAPSINQILPIVQIQSSIKHLLESYRFYKHLNDEPQLKEITTIASTFFYYMINAINENINSFHPAQDLCTVVLSQIGVIYLVPSHGVHANWCKSRIFFNEFSTFRRFSFKIIRMQKVWICWKPRSSGPTW